MTVYEPDPDQLKKLLSLTYEEFCRTRCVVKIYSQVLETEILLASDPTLIDPSEGIVYSPGEIAELSRIRNSLNPHYEERLKKIHNAKAIFGGGIVSGNLE
jgi:hypothetical protein